MTPDELRITAIRIWSERGYSVALARFLRMERTQVWRYLSGRTPIPGPVEAAIREKVRTIS
jgi:hypothetical protein